MKTNKLPQSVWTDEQGAGSQSQPVNQSNSHYLTYDKTQPTARASNDANYDREDSHHLAGHPYLKDNHEPKNGHHLKDTYAAYNSLDSSLIKAEESAMNTKNAPTNQPKTNKTKINNNSIDSGYKKAGNVTDITPTLIYQSDNQLKNKQVQKKSNNPNKNTFEKKILAAANSASEIPERVFMNGLVKHTAIALAIIIPLAAFSAYADAAPQVLPANTTPAQASINKTAALAVEPAAIIHKSATTPTTVDSVDLKRYAGTWYEIGRLPMYFQRNCARDVTATYTGKTDGSGITVINKCTGADGTAITAEGLAKPADDSGSKLKVSFLPSWIRWLPVGRADYWVLARDADYKTALVGTPDKDYLWLLARSPNITQQTYAKYRQIARQQGYDLKEFKLTPQTKQTVNLVP